MAERKGPRNKGVVRRIELPLDPVGPDPVQIVLNGLCIDKPPGMKKDTGPQQLNGLLDLGGLGKTAQPRQKGDRIEHPVGPGCPLGDKPPRNPSHKNSNRITISSAGPRTRFRPWFLLPAPPG